VRKKRRETGTKKARQMMSREWSCVRGGKTERSAAKVEGSEAVDEPDLAGLDAMEEEGMVLAHDIEYYQGVKAVEIRQADKRTSGTPDVRLR